jgi:hypothetical protein
MYTTAPSAKYAIAATITASQFTCPNVSTVIAVERSPPRRDARLPDYGSGAARFGLR